MVDSIIKPLFERGIEEMLKEDREAEATKTGRLRGGNSGIYLPEKGIVAGKCHRLSYLRYKGIQVSEIDASRKLMFRAGLANEDLWLEVLKKSYKGRILTEEEIPTKWITDNGIEVTGRPDIVLCDSELKEVSLTEEQVRAGVTKSMEEVVKPKVGIELKQICSVWTARDVLLEGRPKFDHLVQAAHYSWQLGIPFELWYTSRMDWHGNPMLDRCLPKYGTEKFDKFREFFQPAFYKMVMSRNGNLYNKRISEKEFKEGEYGFAEGYVNCGILKLLPFVIGYTLSWEDNVLKYCNTFTGESKKTIITKDSIKEYYNLVSRMDDTEDLGPRPQTFKGDGTKANYSNCSYCPLQDTCDKYDNKEKGSLNSWVAEVKKVTENG